VDFAQELKGQVDIVRVISDYVRLRRYGNRFSGLCPFHNEKTPSFSVYNEHQYFKCFGCDAKGDVFNFVMNIEGLTFWEALKKLAEQHGIPLPKQSLAGDERTKVRAGLYEMHEIALEHFQRNLAAGSAASVRSYLGERGVTKASVDQFQIGYADGSGRSLLKLLEQRGFRPEQLETSGLVARRDDGGFYDRFRNRVMFPIHNESGKAIAFGGRALDPEDKAKYMNSPETDIYKKSQVLYNLFRAKNTAMKLDRILLVEGYMDVIGATQAGATEAVATCGTALTVEQIRAMKRHSQNLHLNFDPDSAGAKAAERSIAMLLDENMRIRIVELEGGLDPDEYCKEHGAEAYLERVAKAKAYFYWLADRARGRFDMRDPQGRVDAFKFLMPSIHGLHDPIERAAVAQDIATYLGLERGLVLDQFRKVALDRTSRQPQKAADPARATDRILLPVLLTDSDVRDQILGSLQKLNTWRRFSTAPIYETLLKMHENRDAISYETVNARLSESQQEMLAGIVLVREENPQPTVDDAHSCLVTLQRHETEDALRELRNQIRLAEREGRIAEALDLMQKEREMTRFLNGLR
jgi:DNA primase